MIDFILKFLISFNIAGEGLQTGLRNGKHLVQDLFSQISLHQFQILDLQEMEDTSLVGII